MISYTTFQDVIDHGIDYLGSNPSDQTRRDCVRAALEAYRDIANAFNWTYLYTQSRVVTNSSYDSGVVGATLTYVHTGGTYERMATISGDVWPAWAGDGVIRVGDVGYKVDQRISATVVTLDEVINPGRNLAAGTEFQIYQDTYLLPEDFVAQDQALYERNFGGMEYTHPREWLFENRYVFAQGTPQYFTITGDRKYPGRLVSRIFPWPYENKTIDFVYKRRPSRLLTPQESAGKVTVASGSTAVTGVGTAFSPKLVGGTIRVSGNGLKPPTSIIMGSNVAVFESIVTAYVSPTSLVIQDPLDASYSNVCYSVSDTIDIEPGAMLNCYLRCVEKHLSMSRTLKDKPSASRQYDQALAEAKSADSRSFTGRAVGQVSRYRPRLRDMPSGPDEP